MHRVRSVCIVIALFSIVLIIPGLTRGTPQSTALSQQTIRQSIKGTTYENLTADFTLTVPKDWVVSDTLTKLVPGIVGMLQAPGGSGVMMVQRYYVPGPRAGAQFLDAQFKQGMKDYRKLSEGELKIDGKDSYFFICRAVFPLGPPDKAIQLPARLQIVLIPDGETVLGFMSQTPESEFEKFKPIFDKIISSYKKRVE